MRNVRELLQDIQEVKNMWNERDSFELKGVRNLSQSDLDIIEMYANEYAKTGSFNGLMKPLGNIKTVLSAYGLEDSSSSLFW